MRLTMKLVGVCSFSVLALSGVAPSDVHADPSASVPGDAAPTTDAPKDLLGNMVVVASATARALPKIGVVPSLSADSEDVALRTVVRRDLDLCGEFEVLAEEAAPPGLYLSDSPVDVKAWRQKGAEAVVRLSASVTGDQVQLVGQAFLATRTDGPVFEKKAIVAKKDIRVAAHRMADVLIGALTGQNGGFASRMTFAAGVSGDKVRRIYVIDADGHGGQSISNETETALAPAFGKDEQVYWTASTNNGPYRVRSETGKEHVLPVAGSVYGVAFSKDRSKVAVSIGVGSSIQLFAGADLGQLSLASSAPFAMEPTFTPTGKLAFVGLGLTGQRIFVDDKPVTPDGVFSMSPTFCNHPDGVKLIFAAGASTETDLFVTGEQGGSLGRLTQDQGRNSAPACSPDGRLVAFFSTRKSGEGPGLYIMRADGLRPKRISPLMGDSLRWDPLPPETKAPAAPAAK